MLLSVKAIIWEKLSGMTTIYNMLTGDFFFYIMGLFRFYLRFVPDKDGLFCWSFLKFN